MVKRWLTLPRYDRPGSHLECFLNIQLVHSQKMIDPQLWQTRISFRIYLRIQHVHGQKMIDTPQVWQTRISPRIFFKDSTCAWSKDDWLSTQLWQTRISFRFFLKIQDVHGQKMIDPPGMTDQDLI